MPEPVHPTNAETEFRRFLTERGLDPNSVSVARGVDAALAFFQEVRFGPLADGDGDMLLFQWGTYDWGEGKHFEVDITRQLIWPSPDDEEEQELWQLSLRFRFEPDDELQVLRSGSQWWDDPLDLREFRSFIDDSDGFGAVSERTDADVELSFGSAE